MTSDLERVTHVIVNGTITIISLFTTLFFCFCLLFSKNGQEEGLKQPLLLLLWSVVGWNGFVQLAILLSSCMEFQNKNMRLQWWFAKTFILKCTFLLSVSSTAWLNIFYHNRIVPAERAFFTWMKKNIKRILYWSIAVDKAVILSYIVTNAVSVNVYLEKLTNGHSGNFTLVPFNGTEVRSEVLYEVVFWGFFIEMAYVALYLIVTTLTSCTTVLYLWKHVRRMQVTTNSSFSSPSLQSQWRVTITGIVQIGLSLFCCISIIISCLFSMAYHDIVTQGNIICTLISLFSFGTNITMGVGQTLFRQQAADLWNRAVQIPQLCGFHRA